MVRLLPIVVILLFNQSVSYADVWLTEHEVRFLEALGRDVTIDGKQHKLPSDISKFKSIGQQAPTPLRNHILEIAKAYEQMQVTPKERDELDALLKKAAEETPSKQFP